MGPKEGEFSAEGRRKSWMLVLNFWRANQTFGLQKENLALFDPSLIIDSQYSGDQREKIAAKGRHRK